MIIGKIIKYIIICFENFKALKFLFFANILNINLTISEKIKINTGSMSRGKRSLALPP